MAEPDDAATRSHAGHYFDAAPLSPSAQRRITVELAGLTLDFITDSGVFSPHRLDPGTRLLLSKAPPLRQHERRVLDLGCGWGAVACVTALRHRSAEVIAVDTNQRARLLTRRNADANGAGNVTVLAPDDAAPSLRFDRILSNPPIRIGKPALHRLLASWLDRLSPAGRAHLVVHRHLGSDSLARWLARRGHQTKRLTSRSGYRLLEASAASST